MSMDYIFTEIDSRSYDAVVRNGWISELLLAMLVDPLEADDMANSILRRKESSIELYVNGRVFDAPISLEDFHDLPSKYAFEKLKITMSQWVMTNDRADNAVRTITMWNLRFGVWCACAAAREALRFIPEGELRPLLAIEAAEAWVRGRATGQRVAAAADAAYAASYAAARAVDAADVDAYTASAEAAADAAAAAASAAGYGTAESAATVTAAATAGSAVAYANAAVVTNITGIRDANWRSVRDAELVRLREVVANACLTFPG